MTPSSTVRRAALLALLLAVPGLHAAEVAGIRIADSVRVGNSELVLNGAGLRTKVFLKIYVGALYVSQKTTTPSAVIDGNGPRRMAIRLMRDLESDSLQNALDDGLKNNHTPAELAGIKAQSEQFAGIMKAIGKAREGDTIALDMSAEGVVVSLNGDVRGRVDSAVFARALLRVWLGEKPSDASLKKALLGA